MLKKLIVSGVLVLILGTVYSQNKTAQGRIPVRDSIRVDNMPSISIEDVQKAIQLIGGNDKILLKEYNLVIEAYKLLIQIADERRKKKA